MLENIKIVRDIIENSLENYGDRVAFRIREGESGPFTEYTYEEAIEISRVVSAYLCGHLKLKKGDRVALLAENSPHWAMIYLGIVYNGTVAVPIDARLDEYGIKFILEHSGTKYLFATKRQYDKIRELPEIEEKLKEIIIIDNDMSDVESKKVVPMSKILDVGRETLKKGEKWRCDVREDDLLELIYTSGTTGTSKGVMLTHKNIVFEVKSLVSTGLIAGKDRFLSILPLHHTYECTGGFLTPFSAGATITFSPSLKSRKIIADLKDSGTNKMLVVPLFLDKMLDAILRNVNAKPWFVKMFFYALYKTTKGLNKLSKKKAVGKKLFKFIRKKAGLDGIDFMVSGAAPMSQKTAEGFQTLGLLVLQGYGLTEASPVVSVNLPHKNKPKSVGPAIPGVEVKIHNPNEEGIGEIIVRGDNVMKGYYKNEEATREVLKDGWLFTGDLGYMDEDGYIYITGRAKNVIVTPGGKNVYPEEIEEKLNESPFILESLVIGVPVSEDVKGENIFAYIVPDYDYIETFASVHAVKVDDEKIEELIRNEVKKVNQSLPAYKKIKDFRIRTEELPKTSTKKIKRYLFTGKDIKV